MEKGFERTAFDLELVDPKAQINLLNWTIRLSGATQVVLLRRKGIRINISELELG